MPIMRQDLLPDGGGAQVPDTIIVHAMAERIICGPWEQENGIAQDGEILSPGEYLARAGWSCHVIVHADGTATRHRKDSEGAWHAAGFNKNSLGIEIEVPGEHTGETFLEAIKVPGWPTRASMDTAVTIMRNWLDMWMIENIQRHSDVDPERKKDPGQGFPWGELLERVRD